MRGELEAAATEALVGAKVASENPPRSKSVAASTDFRRMATRCQHGSPLTLGAGSKPSTLGSESGFRNGAPTRRSRCAFAAAAAPGMARRARRARRRSALQGEGAGSSPWLDRKATPAAYLGVSVSRLEKDRTVPAHRWEGRVLYQAGRARRMAARDGAAVSDSKPWSGSAWAGTRLPSWPPATTGNTLAVKHGSYVGEIRLSEDPRVREWFDFIVETQPVSHPCDAGTAWRLAMVYRRLEVSDAALVEADRAAAEHPTAAYAGQGQLARSAAG